MAEQGSQRNTVFPSVGRVTPFNAAEPCVVRPTARQLSGVTAHIPSTRHFTLRLSSAIPEPCPTNSPHQGLQPEHIPGRPQAADHPGCHLRNV
jgi:hypothetical protein